jgi:hypothetical protein
VAEFLDAVEAVIASGDHGLKRAGRDRHVLSTAS